MDFSNDQEFYPSRQENSDFRFVLNQTFGDSDDESSNSPFRLNQEFDIPDQ